LCVGSECSGRDRINLDTLAGPFRRKRFGELQQGTLGCRVGNQHRLAENAGCRCDIYDLARALADKVLTGRASQGCGRIDVYCHDIVPDILFLFEKTAGRCDSGVVHDDVEPSEVIDGFPGQLCHALGVKHVALPGVDIPGSKGFQFLQFIERACYGEYTNTLLDQCSCRCPSKPTAGAGNNRDFSIKFEIDHCTSSVSLRAIPKRRTSDAPS